MLRFLTFLALAFIVTHGFSLHANDIYVNNATGHDRNLGQSSDTADGLAGPVRTIGRAIELSRSGDRIFLAPTETPYRETVCLFGKNQSGDDFTAFTIEGNGAILDGSELLPIEVWSHAFGNTFRFQPTRFTHFQLFENGLPLKRVAVEPGAKMPPHLNEMEWCICNGFLYVCLENFKRPQDYRFTYSEKMTGMTIMQTNHVRINDLVVQGFQVDGISIVNNTKNVILDNVIVRGNGRNGLTVGASSTVYAGYSLFGDNNAAQIDMAERSELLLFLSDLKGFEYSAITPKSPQFAVSKKIVNNGGTLREIGTDGVEASEASEKPDIANLWGKLVPVSTAKQPSTTPTSTSTLTSVTQTIGNHLPEQESKQTSPDSSAIGNQTPPEPESSPLQSGDDDISEAPPVGDSDGTSPFDIDFGDTSF
ncbi:MAG: hypothetical protein FWH27_17280 [Planctomycetaceae bacterium]|nr:hypothetical protein [Planctomycetaceae bacterium]